jgi:hypothetical protein
MDPFSQVSRAGSSRSNTGIALGWTGATIPLSRIECSLFFRTIEHPHEGYPEGSVILLHAH